MKLIKHFATICRHRAVVFRQCCKCGLFWQGLIHDLSKFSPAEFIESAKYFQGDRSPIEASKECSGYSLAWQHHKGHNPHHWEYWIDFGTNGEIIPQKIPYKYVVEMVCDYIGAGMVYNGDKWSESEPYDYWAKVKQIRHFHPDTEILLEFLLLVIKQQGLKVFYKTAQRNSKIIDLATDYIKNKGIFIGDLAAKYASNTGLFKKGD